MIPPINVEKMVDFLVGLLNTPSPTGDADRAIAYVQQAFADQIGRASCRERV